MRADHVFIREGWLERGDCAGATQQCLMATGCQVTSADLALHNPNPSHSLAIHLRPEPSPEPCHLTTTDACPRRPPPRQPGNVILFPDAPDSFARAKLHLTFDCRCCPGAVVCAPCTKLLGPEACPHAAPGHPGYCIKVCDCINENSFTAIGGGPGVFADGEPAGSMNWRNRQSGFCSLPLTCYNFSYTTRRVALPDGTPIQPNWDLYKKWRALPHRPSPPVVAAVSSLATSALFHPDPRLARSLTTCPPRRAEARTGTARTMRMRTIPYQPWPRGGRRASMRLCPHPMSIDR